MGKLVVDLSSNNPKPNFRTLKNSGVEGVILKISEGASYNASWDVYSDWSAEARSAGLRVGAYHYAKPSGGDARAEALNFSKSLKRAGGIKRRDFRPALDLEESNIVYSQLYNWARTFNQTVREQGLPTPLFYSYPYFISHMNAPKPIGNGLWLASYGRNDGKRYAYKVPHPWQKVHLHQYTSRGRLAGVYPLDINYIESLRAILAHPIIGLV